MTDSGAKTTTQTTNVVVIEWDDLVRDDNDEHILPLLEEAYGPNNGIGIVAIRNVPDFVQAKESFLPLGHKLATLPTQYLEDHLTDKASLYNAGWSYGKEKLGDVVDTAKGSYYYNPITDVPGTEQDRQQYPLSYPCNVWPNRDVIDPTFQEKAKRIGIILKDACVHVAKYMDKLAERNQKDNYTKNLLYSNLKDTEKVKARLLYYFPLNDDETKSNNHNNKEDSWIGWHNDSGFLTALAGDMYVNHETGERINDIDDDEAGLYVTTKDGIVMKVDIPYDCLAVQIGECTQIVTGGTVQATPHCVKAPSNNKNIGRIALPVFVDVPPTYVLNSYNQRKQVLQYDCSNGKVPALSKRWINDTMAFGDFLQTTFTMYYDWNSKQK